MSITEHSTGRPPPDVPLDEIDIGTLEFWALPEDYREGAFATLRRERPVAFFSEPEVPGFPVGPGFWALTKLDDVWHASRHPAQFSSRPSIVIGDIPEDVAEFYGSMIALDDPRHHRLRSIVQKAFTPRMVTQLEQAVADRTRGIVERMVERHPDGECDFVAEVAAPLPLQIICDMMGIPPEDEERVFHWTNVILGMGDEEVASDYEVFLQVSQDVGAYAYALAEDRRNHPRDDLTTALVQAEVDGERLTSSEIASFFILLITAGNETTRNAISHGLVALTANPAERDAWWADFDGVARTAAEEIVRWASPVIYMRRTLKEDVEVRGVPIRAGEKVAMFYASANRDEDHFPDPFRFDVRRDPNPQVGYGAGGPHFCLGANLARREITMAFRELHRMVPDIHASSEAAILQSGFIHGIKRLRASWTPPSG
jgi:methyl-branched lipid omega-hydroxylase